MRPVTCIQAQCEIRSDKALHVGLTNDFLIKTASLLAMRYNDHSPLENHHASSSFTVLYQHLNNGQQQVRQLRACLALITADNYASSICLKHVLAFSIHKTSYD